MNKRNINFNISKPYASLLAIKICMGDLDDISAILYLVEDYDYIYIYEEQERINIGSKNMIKHNTLLELACKHKRTSIAMYILDNATNIQHIDTIGRNAISHATYNNMYDVVDALLKRGADINISDLWGYTPLMAALLIDSPAIAQLYLDNDVDINVVNKYGESVLHIACKCGYGHICMQIYDRSHKLYSDKLTHSMLSVKEYIRIYCKLYRINQSEKLVSLLEFENYVANYQDTIT